jgi:hypothetical protein
LHHKKKDSALDCYRFQGEQDLFGEEAKLHLYKRVEKRMQAKCVGSICEVRVVVRSTLNYINYI